MLQYVNAPADQLLISAIARGQGLVAPPPEETIQRIGPPPEYLTEAFNMLRDQMRMGLPEGTKSFADQMAEQAEELRIESLALDNAAKQQNIENAAVVASDAHEAAVTSNEAAVANIDNSNVAASDAHVASVTANDAAVSSAAFSASVAGEGVQGAQATEYSGLYEQWMAANPGKADVIHGAIAGLTQDEAIDWMKGQLKEEEVAAPEVIDWSKDPDTIARMEALQAESLRRQEDAERMRIAEEEAAVSAEDVFEQLIVPPEEVEEAAAPGFIPTGGFQRDVAPVVDISPPAQMPTVAEDVAAAIPMPGPMGAISTPATPAPGLIPEGGLQRDVPTVVDTTPASPDPFARRGRAGGGMVGRKEMTMVGESGPELALFPHGTEIVPLDRKMLPSQARRLRRDGVRGMQEGGIVFDNPLDNPLPLGIRQLQAGRSLGAPRGQLLRTAGIALPSAQARRRMLPSEREAFAGLGRMAGIPAEEFQLSLIHI